MTPIRAEASTARRHRRGTGDTLWRYRPLRPIKAAARLNDADDSTNSAGDRPHLALAGSQIPEFAQQYRQRLGGAIDELNRMIAQFDSEAAGQSLTRA